MPDRGAVAPEPEKVPARKKQYATPELVVQGTMADTPEAVAGAAIDGLAGSVPL